MWTNESRARYDRSELRYPNDLTDEDWTLVAPLIPPGKSGGGKRRVIMREIVNGLMYVLSTGCPWRAIPERPAAEKLGPRLLRPVDPRRYIGSHAPRAL
jgi:transposase